MKYFMYPVIESDEIENAIKLQYDVEIDMVKLFFDCGYNGLEYLSISEEEDSYDEDYNDLDEDSSNAKLRILVRGYLRDVMPADMDCIIVHFEF